MIEEHGGPSDKTIRYVRVFGQLLLLVLSVALAVYIVTWEIPAAKTTLTCQRWVLEHPAEAINIAMIGQYNTTLPGYEDDAWYAWQVDREKPFINLSNWQRAEGER